MYKPPLIYNWIKIAKEIVLDIAKLKADLACNSTTTTKRNE